LLQRKRFSLVADRVLTDVNIELKRPMGKSVRQHLLDAKSHSSGCLRTVRTNQLQALSELYLRARCGTEVWKCVCVRSGPPR